MNYNGELTNYNPYVKRKSLKNWKTKLLVI
jgi:hypothetical protein